MKSMTFTEFCKLSQRDFEDSAALKWVEALLSHMSVLEEALRCHKHTDACFYYAIETASRFGSARCLGECMKARKAMMGEPNDANADD